MDQYGFDQTEEKDFNRFVEGRNGDHLICTFQSDLCLFYTLKGRTPIDHNLKDKFLLTCLRRANLDDMWAREPSTVAANKRDIDRLVRLANRIGVGPTLEPVGSFPSIDYQGIFVAVAMLQRSLEPGRYALYSQSQTIRKLRSA